MILVRDTVISKIRGGIVLLPLGLLRLFLGGQLFHKLLVFLTYVGRSCLHVCRPLRVPVCIIRFPAVFRRTIRILLTAILGVMGVHGRLAPLSIYLTSNLLLVRPILRFSTRGFVLGIPRDWIIQLAFFLESFPFSGAVVGDHLAFYFT